MWENIKDNITKILKNKIDFSQDIYNAMTSFYENIEKLIQEKSFIDIRTVYKNITKLIIDEFPTNQETNKKLFKILREIKKKYYKYYKKRKNF